MHRRSFLQLPVAAAAGAADSKIQLGFDSYSIRAFAWKAPRLLEYAAGLHLDTIQFSSLNDFDSLDPAYLRSIKEQAARLGISIDGGIGCVCPTAASWNAKYGSPAEYLVTGLRAARELGARSMRCFIASPGDRKGPLPVEAHLESTLKGLREARSRALDTGVKIAIENHGDVTARELQSLIEAAGVELTGACLDTGNPMLVLEDPMLTLEVLGPYALTTHVRDSALCEHPRGAMFQWVALGDGVVDWTAFLARFRQLCPKSALQLEIITGRPPQVLPYLEQDFWKAFPKLPAADFARFTALARRGKPYLGPMIVTSTEKQPPEYEAALKEQQRRDLERSFAVAKKMLR